MQKTDHKNYRALLRERLSKRLSLNPKYSQRAFARDLSISPGQLSLVLNGKKGISPEKAEQMLKVLGLGENERRLYRLQVAQEHARSSRSRNRAADELSKAQDHSHLRLTQDAFEIISEWQHFAILQTLVLNDVIKLKTSKDQLKIIAKKLKLQEIEVEVAIERMMRIELIEIKNHSWKICHDTVFTTDGVPSQALRIFHAQVLKKATEALELQTLDERYPNTIMLPILMKDFVPIRQEMLSFQKKIMKKYGRVIQGDGEQVYALTQQLFKLTEEK